jgi:hypothetical protein
MAKQIINIGTNQDDGTGDLLRSAFTKVNDNFNELYGEIGDGSGLTDLKLSGNTISTDNSNQNIILSPNGTGKIDSAGDILVRGASRFIGQVQTTSHVVIGGNLTITGTTNLSSSLTTTSLSSNSISTGTTTATGNTIGTSATYSAQVNVQGLLNASGNVDLGDATSDTITATARFDSGLIPSANNTQDLGASSLRWNNLYVKDLNVSGISTLTGSVIAAGKITTDNIEIESNTIQNIATNQPLILDAHGTGNVIVNAGLTVGSSQVIDFTSNKITNVGSPVAGSDAANKTYVDAKTLQDITSTGATSSSIITLTGSLNVDFLTFAGNKIRANATNADIDLDPSGTGVVSIHDDRLNLVDTYTPASANGAAGDRKGDIAFDASYVYYCTANYDGSNPVWKRVAISTW